MIEIKDDTATETATETAAPSPAPAAKTNGGSKKKAAVKTKSTKKAVKAKSKATKKATKKFSKPGTAASTQAQSGPALDIAFDKMNKAEQKIVAAVFTPKGDRKPFTIKELMAATKLKSSPVRNGVRRPVRGRWIEPVGRGTYRLTEAARKRGIPKGA